MLDGIARSAQRGGLPRNPFESCGDAVDLNLWGPTIDMERKKYDELGRHEGVKCHTHDAWCPRLEDMVEESKVLFR